MTIKLYASYLILSKQVDVKNNLSFPSKVARKNSTKISLFENLKIMEIRVK